MNQDLPAQQAPPVCIGCYLARRLTSKNLLCELDLSFWLLIWMEYAILRLFAWRQRVPTPSKGSKG